MSIPAHSPGTVLPELVVELDRTLIVAGAIASQDFEDVHHDPGAAQARGTRDVFMSINTTNGWIDKYLTDWAGPSARLLSVGLRLGVPNFAGDTMTMTGEVTAVEDGVTTVTVTGRNSLGVHVTATATLQEATR
jgi:hypothetical protein